MKRFLLLLMRGLLLRCPVCGQGKLFSGIYKMNEHCPVCQFKFEREEGYYTSSMAINLVVSELIAAAVVLPLAAIPSIPVLPVLLIGGPFALILPLLLFRPSRGLWLAMDHYLNPTSGNDLPDESPLLQRSRGVRSDH
ncbi:DUF983 domain-containing protein [Dictyobacter aurantiacus]|uniref:DUF983 domain-containing protein n=1 Tax=Dictyobacter aurantiacus TaxID=1936993 RepID=A0A401ZG72_9CHLR|nr:DUF983 domain-containing protein [Dictyobacter aurantiacus]GCE05875.1 hypothetical protein KDAU_32040 [Dictyobacter aurantiacus]